MSRELLNITGRLILFAALSGGCMSNINENVVRVESDRRLGKYVWVDRVAVIPFDGTPKGRQTFLGIKKKWPGNAGMIVSGLFASQLSKAGRHQVMGPVAVRQELEKSYPEPVSGFLSPREVKEVGSALRTDALVVGDVIEYYTYQYHTLKQSRVSVRIKMIDAHTGNTMWKGEFCMDDTGKPYDLARRGCEQIIAQFRERIGGKRE